MDSKIERLTHILQDRLEYILCVDPFLQSKDNGAKNVMDDAIRGGCISVVKTLLDNGFNVNANIGDDEDTFTPLMVAAHTGELDILKLLLEKGADIYSIDYDGDYVMHFAVRSGSLEIVEHLLHIGVKVTIGNTERYTPLQLACLDGFLDIVLALLRKGAEVNGFQEDASSPLSLSCGRGDIEVVKLLLSYGANILEESDEGYTAFHSLCISGKRYDCDDRLLNEGSVIEKSKTEILRIFIEREGGYIGLNKEITDEDGDTLLHMATESGDLDKMKLLLENGADVNNINYGGVSPLFLVSEEITWGRNCLTKKKEWNYDYDSNLHELLIEHGASVNGKGCFRTILYSAVLSDNIVLIKGLLDNGADINGDTSECVDPDTDIDPSPIRAAVVRKNCSIVELLLKRGADVNYLDRDNKYLIDLALDPLYEEKDMVELLLKYGADISHIKGNNAHVVNATENLRKRKFGPTTIHQFIEQEVKKTRIVFLLAKHESQLKRVPNPILREICSHIVAFDPVKKL